MERIEMRLRRFVVATAVIAAVVAVGVFAAWPVTRAALASEPASEGTPTPEPTATPVPAATATPEPTAEPAPAGTAVPLKIPDKSETVISKAERPRSGAAASVQGTVYTWEDGDRTLRVALQEDLVVQKTADISPDDVVVAKGAADSIVQKRAKHGQDALPVFKPESGGGLMTLPGGVLIALDPGWDEDTIDSFLSKNGISTDRTSELGFIVNGFVVETEPGFPSLELANELASQDGVMISSPNWWMEVETK